MTDRNIPGKDEEIELVEIDKLFRELEQEESLPTFGDHFMMCLILGIAENVNLKKMYPKTFLKLGAWLEKHNNRMIRRHKADK